MLALLVIELGLAEAEEGAAARLELIAVGVKDGLSGRTVGIPVVGESAASSLLATGGAARVGESMPGVRVGL